MKELKLRVAFVSQDGVIVELTNVNNKNLADGISDLSDELLKRI